MVQGLPCASECVEVRKMRRPAKNAEKEQPGYSTQTLQVWYPGGQVKEVFQGDSDQLSQMLQTGQGR